MIDCNLYAQENGFKCCPLRYFDCPDYVVALLSDLSEKMKIAMWNKNQKEYDSPFENTGNSYKGNKFEVHAYDWDENPAQDYNFKYEDIEIKWYKYLGRETVINGFYNYNKIIKMYNACIEEIRNIYKEED